MSMSEVEKKSHSLFTDEQRKIIRQTIAKEASEIEFEYFMTTCERSGLDPLKGQIYLGKRKNSDTNAIERMPVTKIDGFRSIAERSKKYAGQIGPFWSEDGVNWLEVWLKPTPPPAAKVQVIRHDFKEPMTAVARYETYKQTYFKDGQTRLGPVWTKMPDLMLAKCAEALALRRAFPDELGGLYTSDEMGQALNNDLDANNSSDAVIEPTYAPLPEKAEPEKIEKMCELCGKTFRTTYKNAKTCWTCHQVTKASEASAANPINPADIPF